MNWNKFVNKPKRKISFEMAFICWWLRHLLESEMLRSSWNSSVDVSHVVGLLLLKALRCFWHVQKVSQFILNKFPQPANSNKNKVSKFLTIAKEGHTWNNQSFSENYCFLHINRFQISCEKHKNSIFFVSSQKHAHVYNSSSSQKQHERKRIKSQNCCENSLERKETSLRQFQSLNCELIENRHFFAFFNSIQPNNVTCIDI